MARPGADSTWSCTVRQRGPTVPDLVRSHARGVRSRRQPCSTIAADFSRGRDPVRQARGPTEASTSCKAFMTMTDVVSMLVRLILTPWTRRCNTSSGDEGRRSKRDPSPRRWPVSPGRTFETIAGVATPRCSRLTTVPSERARRPDRQRSIDFVDEGAAKAGLPRAGTCLDAAKWRDDWPISGRRRRQ